MSIMKEAVFAMASGGVVAALVAGFSTPAIAQPISSVTYYASYCFLDGTLSCNQPACTTFGAACTACTNVMTYGECYYLASTECTQFDWGATGCGFLRNGACITGPGGPLHCSTNPPNGSGCQRFTCR